MTREAKPDTIGCQLPIDRHHWSWPITAALLSHCVGPRQEWKSVRARKRGMCFARMDAALMNNAMTFGQSNKAEHLGQTTENFKTGICIPDTRRHHFLIAPCGQGSKIRFRRRNKNARTAEKSTLDRSDTRRGSATDNGWTPTSVIILITDTRSRAA